MAVALLEAPRCSTGERLFFMDATTILDSSAPSAGAPAATAVDEELSQAKARLGVCILALAYIGAWTLLSKPVGPIIGWAVGAYAVFSAAWIVLVAYRPGRVRWRRVLVIVSDLGINSLFLHLLQEKGAFFYPVYLWIIVGNGMRYGPRYLVLATITAVAYFAPMLALSPYWKQNQAAGSGLLAGMVVLPLFYLALIRRLHETNLQLAAEVERSQAAVHAKNNFLANMSHELRTPMNGVIGVAELLRLTPLDDQQESYVELVERSANALLLIIDDILDFSRLEAGRIELQREPLDVERIMRDVFDLLIPSAEEKGLTLHLEIPRAAQRAFVGDATRIRQILFNLLGNAVKFTERGRIELRYRADLRDDGRWSVRFIVADTGVGIAEDNLERIFEKFERAQTRLDHQVGGSGLGLAIGRQLARMMGGDIAVASRPGAGATFTAWLVLEAGDQLPERPSRARALPAEIRGLRALVVEDNAANRLVICSFLDQLGITHTTAADGESAVSRWRALAPDVILMDVRLPNLDGLEATRRIRASEPDDRHVAIVAVTANASKSDAAQCLGAGMDLFLAKPLHLEDLADAIQSLLDRGLVSPAGDPRVDR